MESGIAGLPRQTHSGVLNFGDVAIECAVLEGGRRVIIAESMKSLTGDRQTRRDRRREGEKVPVTKAVFELPGSIKPFAEGSLKVPVTAVSFYSSKTGRVENGHDAEVIPGICDAYLNARDAGKLNPSLNHIADRCYKVVRALARVGIVALIDEATGYQKVRPDDDLQGILARTIQRWRKTFEDEFWGQIERLYGYRREWRVCGKFINEYVYERLAPGVLESILRKNPVLVGGQRAHHHHQFLSPELGHPMLKTMLEGVLVIMATSQDRAHFEKRMDMFYPNRRESQVLLPVEGARFGESA